MSHEYRVGDLVRLVQKHPTARYSGPALGALGVVMHLRLTSDGSLGVRWDKAFEGGHDGHGEIWCDVGHGWYVHRYKVRYAGWRVNPEKYRERG